MDNDLSHNVAVATTLGAATAVTIGRQLHDSALKYAESASTLHGAADRAEQALRIVDDHPGSPYFQPPRPADFARAADAIEHGVHDMSGKQGPNAYRMPAVEPLRRAAAMPDVRTGIAELRVAASRATAAEVPLLRQSRNALVAAGLLGMATAASLVNLARQGSDAA